MTIIVVAATRMPAMDELFLRALLAGGAVAIAAGPLGAFVVWRRNAYFGDTLAHAALLGVGLGMVFGIGADLSVLALCVAMACTLVLLQRRLGLAGDTLLGIMAHGGLALGIVMLALARMPAVDLMSYLFGDILLVARGDLYLIGGATAVAVIATCALWRPLLSATVSEELAAAEGIPVLRVRLMFTILLAIMVAIAMKVVGILLVTALLIVPAAAARPLARTPEAMAAIASVLGCIAVLAGLGGAFALDTPAGPTIVVAALALFAATAILPARRRPAPSPPISTSERAT